MSSAPNIAEQGKLAVDSYKKPDDRGQDNRWGQTRLIISQYAKIDGVRHD